MNKRKGPGGESGANPQVIAATLLNDTPQTEVMDADTRRELDLLVEVYNRGYAIAVRCKTCGSWLAHPKSVAAHQGPVCRGREAARG